MYALCGIIISQFLISNAARILVVVPFPSFSTQVVFRPLTLELVRRGHEVVVITPDPAFPKGATPANLTEIDVHDVSYETQRDKLYAHATGKASNVENHMKFLYNTIQEVFKGQMKHEQVQNLFRQNQRFDLVVLLAWFREALIFSHIFKAPVVQLNPCGRNVGSYENVGALSHPILYPLSISRRLYNLTFSEKILQILYEIKMYNTIITDFGKSFDEWVKRNINVDIPTIDNLTKDISLLFSTLHPVWGNNQPVPINFQYLWGLHCTEDKEVSEELQSFLNSSDNGVIYMSFGTNKLPSSLSPDKLRIFLSVFSELPFNIVWKWDKNELPGKPKNIKIGKWFPQQSLLKHQNMKLFITQGGFQSTTEAIMAKVPVIGIPMSADQWFNVEKYVYHRIGIQLDLETLTKEGLRSAILDIIEDKSYSENIRKLNAIVTDQPAPALERAVWWVEHVLRHDGARHLRAPAANISWGHYYEIELLAICLSFITITIIIILKIVKVVLQIFKSRSNLCNFGLSLGK